MKVKLLKKVRKRFSITEYPNGMYRGNKFYDGHVFWINDNWDAYNCCIFSSSDENSSVEKAKNEAFEYLKKVIFRLYLDKGIRRKNKPSRKIWGNV